MTRPMRPRPIQPVICRARSAIAATLFRLDASNRDELALVVQVRSDERRKRFVLAADGTVTDGVDVALLEGRLVDNACDVLLNLGDDIGWRPGRSKYPKPGARIDLRKTRFLQRGHVGK